MSTHAWDDTWNEGSLREEPLSLFFQSLFKAASWRISWERDRNLEPRARSGNSLKEVYTDLNDPWRPMLGCWKIIPEGHVANRRMALSIIQQELSNQVIPHVVEVFWAYSGKFTERLYEVEGFPAMIRQDNICTCTTCVMNHSSTVESKNSPWRHHKGSLAYSMEFNVARLHMHGENLNAKN